jgi:hypothetical protein
MAQPLGSRNTAFLRCRQKGFETVRAGKVDALQAGAEFHDAAKGFADTELDSLWVMVEGRAEMIGVNLLMLKSLQK